MQDPPCRKELRLERLLFVDKLRVSVSLGNLEAILCKIQRVEARYKRAGETNHNA